MGLCDLYFGRDLFGDDPWSTKLSRFLCKAACNCTIWLATTLLVWYCFRPTKFAPHVDSAALAAFDLISPAPPPAPAGTTTTAASLSLGLRYDLALNLTFFSDPGISFGHITAGLYYGGAKLGPSDDAIPGFYQKKRRHRTVHPALRGRASNVSAAVVEAFARDRAAGSFGVHVRVTTLLTYRSWPNKVTKYYEFDCGLRFPPPPGNGTPAVTGGVKCGVAKY